MKMGQEPLEVYQEGNEADNKVFKSFKANLSRKGLSKDSLVDVLKLHSFGYIAVLSLCGLAPLHVRKNIL